MLAETGSYGREALLTELRVRIRDVRMGPDELLYVVTDEDGGELLRIEPDDEPGKEDPVDSTSLPQPHV